MELRNAYKSKRKLFDRKIWYYERQFDKRNMTVLAYEIHVISGSTVPSMVYEMDK